MEQAWEHEALHVDKQQWTALPSFLLEPVVSDQTFSSPTLRGLDIFPWVMTNSGSVLQGPNKPHAWLCFLPWKRPGSGLQPDSVALDSFPVLGLGSE